MTPKEKAHDLIHLFLPEIEGADRYGYNLPDMNIYVAKQCALKCVDEILNGFRKILPSSRPYWEQVRQEIINYEYK